MNARVPPDLVLSPTRYQPPALRPEMVAVMNLAAGRRAIPVIAHGRTITIRLAPPGAGAVAVPEPSLRLDWSVDGEMQAALVPLNLLDALMLQPGPGVAAEAAAMLLESALAPALDRIEATLRRPFVLQGLGAGALGQPANFCLEVEHERTVFPVPLRLGPAAIAALPGLLRELPRPASNLATLPVQLCFRAGLTELSYEELLGIRAGDAVVIQETGLMDGRLAVLVGEQRYAPARLASQGVELEAGLRPLAGTVMRRWCVDNAFDDPVDEDVRALRVTLVFELGRRLASLAEIEAMGPGTVLDTGGWPDGLVDVLANGRRIGRGRIVQVGGALAVQLERINHGPVA